MKKIIAWRLWCDCRLHAFGTEMAQKQVVCALQMLNRDGSEASGLRTSNAEPRWLRSKWSATSNAMCRESQGRLLVTAGWTQISVQHAAVSFAWAHIRKAIRLLPSRVSERA